MDWFRVWRGAVFDPKWGPIAKAVGCRRGDVWAVFSAMLDHAAGATPRGSIESFSIDDAADGIGFEPELVRAIFDAMPAKRVHDGRRLLRWEDRQPLRKDATAADRMRRYRGRKNAAKVTAVTAVTPPDVTTVTDQRYGVTVLEREERSDSLSTVEVHRKAKQEPSSMALSQSETLPLSLPSRAYARESGGGLIGWIKRGLGHA